VVKNFLVPEMAFCVLMCH